MNEKGTAEGRFLLSEKDFIVLSEAKTSEEVFEFLSGAVPFCQYCDMDNINDHVEWQTSKRDIREWIDV